MQYLEDHGMEITKPTTMTVKVGLAYIIGDNLGAHTVSEMSQSFSSGFVCRWCKITYDDIHHKRFCYKECSSDFNVTKWTVEDYDNLADTAESSGLPQQGIKRHSAFNSLKSFHCVGQLPPCCGHDFFEGVFAYDIQFYLDYIVNKEKLMTAECLNEKITLAILSERDASNRPKPFKTRKHGSKYEGNANSLRILSRIITMLISVEAGESVVFPHIIKLQEMSELISAFKLNLYEIDNILHFTIIEYLEMRVTGIDSFGMDSLKPKHHYLSHYSELFKMHGPLIYLWGLRMESKHVFFKNTARNAKSFKNIALTCASRHQMAQISYRYGGLFLDKFFIPKTAPSKNVVLANCHDVQKFALSLKDGSLLPSKITAFGLDYKIGKVLILKKSDIGQTLTVGLVRAIGVSGREICFGCSTFEAEQSQYGYYLTQKDLKSFCHVLLEDLLDFYPLQRIGPQSDFCFSLHHYISRNIH